MKTHARRAALFAVGDIQAELDIAPSTLSHHLEKLKNEDLVTVRRLEVLVAANAEVLQELLGFLFAECSRSDAVKAETSIRLCR